MRNFILTVCLGLLPVFFMASGEDEAKALAAGDKEVRLRSVLPEGGTMMISEYLLQNDPKKLEELKKLRLENHEEFERQMVELSQMLREKSKKEGEELNILTDKFRESGNDGDKAALKAKLQEIMGRKLELQKRRIAEMERNLAQFKTNVAEEEKKIQERIDGKINEILSTKGAKQEKQRQ